MKTGTGAARWLASADEAWRCVAALALCLLCQLAQGDTYAARALIVENDIAEARQQAIRQILQEAGLRGKVEIRATTALINQLPSDVAIYSSALWLDELSIIRESVQNGELTVEARVALRHDKPGSCSPTVSVKNIAPRFYVNSNARLTEMQKRHADLFLGELRQHLGKRYPALQADGEFFPMQPYRLDIRIEPGQSDNDQPDSITQTLTGSDGTLIAQDRHQFRLASLAKQERQSLAYASLIKTVLSSDGLQLIDRIDKALGSQLRCLPVVVRIGERNAAEILEIDLLDNSPTANLSHAFFASRFPVGPGGSLNLLKLEGMIELIRIDQDRLYFALPKQKKGRPFPAPGSFILLQ